jgi:hypothetical protein
MPVFGLEPLMWGKIFAVTFVLHLASTLYLSEVLGRAFDHYWKPRLYHVASGLRENYLATIYYAGAVLSGSVRRAVFGDNGFDFRARVTRTTVLMCLLQGLLLLLLLALAALVAWVVASEGWAAWERIPRPLPPPPPELPT